MCLMRSVSLQNVATVSSAELIPIITFTASLSAYNHLSFTTAPQNDFATAIKAQLPAKSAVTVQLANFRDGSVILDAAVIFLNGDSDTAGALAQLLTVRVAEFHSRAL